VVAGLTPSSPVTVGSEPERAPQRRRWWLVPVVVLAVLLLVVIGVEVGLLLAG
jgi:hypothetical protein